MALQLNLYGNFPPEILQKNIFCELDDREIACCQQVSKWWKANGSSVLDKREEEAFGKRAWEALGYKIEGKLPNRPANIWKKLDEPCPIYGKEGKKVKETHVLFYRPAQINGKPNTFNRLGELLGEKLGKPSGYKVVLDEIAKLYGEAPVKKGEWLLILIHNDGLLPESRGKTYTEQQALVKAIKGEADTAYQEPNLIDTITWILAKFAKSQERFYSDQPWTYTRLQQTFKDESGTHELVIGGFGSDGLIVRGNYFDNKFQGIGALQKL